MVSDTNSPWMLRILETPEDMSAVEELQRLVWPGSETEVVPLHLLVTLAQNGGLVMGAFEGASYQAGATNSARLLGFVYGFPGLYFTPDGARPKHCSHQLGVHPQVRGQGLGFALKRAQWQMVRQQGLDLITWTFDPLLSRNAHLNITRLGGVCSTYSRNLYGSLQDDLNKELLTDRFRVDWWVNSKRVNRRISWRARLDLDLAHFLSANAQIINPSQAKEDGWPRPAENNGLDKVGENPSDDAIVLVEIPSDFLALKAADPELALAWRLHSRAIFEGLFERGYLITDFVYLRGTQPRSFYVMSHGESTL
jgi:predicted GNAT superfamily acetyltransferase